MTETEELLKCKKCFCNKLCFFILWKTRMPITTCRNFQEKVKEIIVGENKQEVQQRLTKKYSDGSYGAADDLPCGENSYEYKDLLINKLGKYEDLLERIHNAEN